MGESFTFHQTMLFGTLVCGIYFVLRVMNEGLYFFPSVCFTNFLKEVMDSLFIKLIYLKL